ncbi:MAG TPA: tocopherol cyclase family protein [Saprospiraceae bacterium]|nr:tocopherol cyclase family protein [Saprospiraceae bacterium]
MFLTKLRALWNPDQYQGWGRTRQYFEGWYFKVVSRDERHAMAFIPGISMGTESHSFIQVMDGKACKATYHRFAAKEFVPSATHFNVMVGPNQFNGQEIRLQLPDISGTLRFQNTTPWPKMLGAPGIMGWYSFVPFMECNHGIVSLDHQLEGVLQIGGKEVDFTGGRGYIEKDWGHSFPRAYVWMQSNHFDHEGKTSLMASVAHIPWLGSYFIGFISGFWLDGRLIKFATYTGAKKHLELSGQQLTLVLQQSGKELRILAQQAAGTALVSPLSGEMTGKIQESLQATIQVELLDKGVRIFEGTGRNAGLEVAGAVEVLTG